MRRTRSMTPGALLPVLLLSIAISVILCPGNVSASDIKIHKCGGKEYVSKADYNSCVDDVNACVDVGIKMSENCEKSFEEVEKKITQAEKEQKRSFIMGTLAGAGIISVVYVVLALIIAL